MSNVLFILKRREDYQAELHSHIGLSTGLYNSASFVNDMLNDLGIDSELELAIDNNCIDSLVTKHRPDYCIIEALWVVPSKIKLLQSMYPNIKWIIPLVGNWTYTLFYILSELWGSVAISLLFLFRKSIFFSCTRPIEAENSFI